MPESVIVPTLVDQRAAGTIRVVIAHGRRLVRAGLNLLTESETDARVLATLRAGAAGLLLEDREPAELVRAVRLLGHGRRLRPRRSHPKQPARESLMLSPTVLHIPRRRHGGQ
jgi:DNA-binding NarL/FixJ family response regulator